MKFFPKNEQKTTVQNFAFFLSLTTFFFLWHFLVWPNGNNFAGESKNDLREKVTKTMRAMAEVTWFCPDDIVYYKSERGVIFKKGETYHGIPYTQKGRYTGLEEFRALLKNINGKPVYSGPIQSDLYRGSDCSSAVSYAWRAADPEFPVLSTHRMTLGLFSKIVKVGDYKITSKVSTEKIVKDNGAAAVYRAYDKLQPGDVLLMHGRAGHVRLVSSLDQQKKTVYDY